MFAQLTQELSIIIFIDTLINQDILVVKKMSLLNNNVDHVVALDNFRDFVSFFDEDKLNPSLTNDFSLEFCYN